MKIVQFLVRRIIFKKGQRMCSGKINLTNEKTQVEGVHDMFKRMQVSVLYFNGTNFD